VVGFFLLGCIHDLVTDTEIQKIRNFSRFYANLIGLHDDRKNDRYPHYTRYGFRLAEERPSSAFGGPLSEHRYELTY
jgi:hypothetical protein